VRTDVECLYDDFIGSYRPELLIYNNDKLIFVEVKSEKETEKAKADYSYKTFRSLRQKVKTLPIKPRHKPWILYIAQLWDYAKNNCITKEAPIIDNPSLLFAFPYNYFQQVAEALRQLCNTLGKPQVSSEEKEDTQRNIKVMIFKKNDIDAIFTPF